ncbi:hypothetical protein C8D90_11411 [Enterobacillus tribolii]|uniref:Uncharacterized protein n=1 Tax=Enterobacillus tribolii TaxID=1487935 RepID=A0A370Q6U6_9GAMM|nr:hypothetical protein C8D90_11411 [Enterobacillus tribolii]
MLSLKIQSLRLFIAAHAQFMTAFWSILIIIMEASIALYILRNI